MILKVVGCEDCVKDNKLPLLGPGGKAPAAGQFLQSEGGLGAKRSSQPLGNSCNFSEKQAILKPFG